ncbi:hypothetical protein PT974_01348 [Cladobotryum mycophilum]|uniref:HNH nuclease domain-containing protein n=1 Tax=Cladobotryum mycophilum TaxID=491253 RepID=A0ABR0T3P6_9HYPO
MSALTVPVISPPLLLKPPRQPFENNAQPSKLVLFLHPGYTDTHNILLTLPAFDSGGIHHETARIACAILANCRWDGFLASSRNGTPLSAGPDDVIPHVLSSSVDDAVRRDVSCRITASTLPNETAHIIPAVQSPWWQRNSMFMHTTDPGRSLDTGCADNTILLRRDLHKLWDDNKFAIVPKQGKWVIHVLRNKPMGEIEKQYHNLELQPLAGVSQHFFLCRFALAIFSQSPFLSQRVPRKLVLVNSDTSMEPLVRTMTVDQYQSMFSTSARAGGSKSQSPKKRAKSATEEQSNDDYVTELSEDDSTDNETEEEEEEEEVRGRPRKRKWEVSYDDVLSSNYLEEKRPRASAGFGRPQTPPRSTSPN